MKKRISLAICALVLTLVGCSKPSVVGKWTATSPDAPGMSADVEFKQDGKMTQAMNFQASGRSLKIDVKGNYTLDASAKEPTLTVKAESGMLNGTSVPIPADKASQTGPVVFDKEGFTWTVSQDGKSIKQVFRKAK